MNWRPPKGGHSHVEQVAGDKHERVTDLGDVPWSATGGTGMVIRPEKGISFQGD